MDKDRISNSELNSNLELPTVKTILKQAAELAIVYGDINEFEESEIESFHRSFKLEDGDKSTYLNRYGISSIEYIPGYDVDSIPSPGQVVFQLLSENGVQRELILFDSGDIQIYNDVAYDDIEFEAMLDTLSPKNKEAHDRAVENLLSPESRIHFDQQAIENEQWLRLIIDHPDELGAEDALKLQNALFGIARELGYTA